MSIITVNYVGNDDLQIKDPDLPDITFSLLALTEAEFQEFLKYDVVKDLLNNLDDPNKHKLTQFFKDCYPKIGGGPQLGSYQSYLKQLKADLLANNPPIIYFFKSKTSTSNGQDGVKVLDGYYTYQYDAGYEKVFIGNPEPECIGTVGSELDTASKTKYKRVYPSANNGIYYTTAFCERVGLPTGFQLIVTTIDDNPKNFTSRVTFTCDYFNSFDQTNLPLPLKQVTIQGKPCIGIEEVIDMNTTKGGAGSIKRYLVGNKKKNIAINKSTTSELDIFLYLLFKELGDFLQMLQFTVYSICETKKNASNWRTILLTGDFGVFYRLVRAFNLDGMHTGVREGVTSGGAKFWHNRPIPFSFDNIKTQITNYNTNIFNDILNHNILTMNYLLKIKTGLNGLLSPEKKVRTQSVKALGCFSLLIKKKDDNVSLDSVAHKQQKTTDIASSSSAPLLALGAPSLAGGHQFEVRKVYMHTFYSICRFNKNDTTQDNADGRIINPDIIGKIVAKIQTEIDKIIESSVTLIIVSKWVESTFKSPILKEGNYNLPYLDTTTLVYTSQLIQGIRAIFTTIISGDFEANLKFAKIEGDIKNLFQQAGLFYAAQIQPTAPPTTGPTALPTALPTAPPTTGPFDGDAELADDDAEVADAELADDDAELADDDAELADDDAELADADADNNIINKMISTLLSNKSASTSASGSASGSQQIAHQLQEQKKGMNTLLEIIGQLEEYQCVRFISVTGKRQFYIQQPSFLLLAETYEIGWDRRQYLMNKDALTDILKNEALASQNPISQGGGASRVTNNHFKYSVRGINRDKRNITTKRTKMRNTANMKGGVKRPIGSDGDSWGKDDEETYQEDSAHDSYYTIDVRQEHLLLYAAGQIAAKLKNISTRDFMIKILYEMLVERKEKMIKILYEFKIPYKDMEIEIKTIGLELEELITYYPDAEAIFLSDAEAIFERDEDFIKDLEFINDIKNKLSRPTPITTPVVSDEEILQDIAGFLPPTSTLIPPPIRTTSVVSDEEILQDIAGFLPPTSTLIPTPIRTTSVVSDGTDGTQYSTQYSTQYNPVTEKMDYDNPFNPFNLDGGYSGINKKKHKSRKNKKTRRNTRRKTKKIRTRKNKQVRRKH
jgi:hypothetical protein